MDSVADFSSLGTSRSFEQWTRLTDAYAKQFFLLHRGVRSARPEAMRLAQELQRLNEEHAAGRNGVAMR
jgi:hypothetical protein